MYRSNKIIFKDLSEHQNVETCYVGSNSEPEQSADAESLMLECENLFNDNDGWKASTYEGNDAAVIRVKSTENDIQRKYEKVIKLRDAVKRKYEKINKLRDAVIEEKKDLKSKIEVNLINILGLNYFF